MYTAQENNQWNEFDNLFKRFEEIVKNICIEYDIELSGNEDKHFNRTEKIMNSKTPFARIMKDNRKHINNLRIIRNRKAHENLLMYPAEECIHLISDIVEKFTHPIRVRDAQLGSIYALDYDTSFYDAIMAMRKNVYTHIPILKNGKYLFTLSESLITKRLYDQINPQDYIACFEGVKVGDVYMEDENENFIFKSQNTPLDEILFEFERYIDSHKRLGAIYVTNLGKRDEEITSIITARDIPTLDKLGDKK